MAHDGGSTAMAFSLILFGFTLLMAVIGGILEAKGGAE
jgi:hypothetical protein